MRAFITPPNVPTTRRCRVVVFPDSPYWEHILIGAIGELANPDNFEQLAGISAEETAAAFEIMRLGLEMSSGCGGIFERVQGVAPPLLHAYFPLGDLAGSIIGEYVHGWHGIATGLQFQAVGPDNMSGSAYFAGVSEYGELFSSQLAAGYDYTNGLTLNYRFRVSTWDGVQRIAAMIGFTGGASIVGYAHPTNGNFVIISSWPGGYHFGQFPLSGDTGWHVATTQFDYTNARIRHGLDGVMAGWVSVADVAHFSGISGFRVGRHVSSSLFWLGNVAHVSTHNGVLTDSEIDRLTS